MNKFRCLLLMIACSVFGDTYVLKVPFPSQVEVTENQGLLNVTATFKATRAFNRQMNKKVDKKHGEHVFYAALKRYFNVEQGKIQYSGRQTVAPPAYEGNMVRFAYRLPRNQVKVIKTAPASSRQQASAAAVPTAPVAPAANAQPAPAQRQPQVVVQPVVHPTAVAAAPVVRRPAAPVVLRPRALNDQALKNLELAGFPVRLKCDFMASFELVRQRCDSCVQKGGWDALEDLLRLKREFRSEFNLNALTMKIQRDSRLLRSDVMELTSIVTQGVKSLSFELDSAHRKLYRTVEHDLKQMLRELEDGVDEEELDADEDVREMRALLNKLQQMRP